MPVPPLPVLARIRRAARIAPLLLAGCGGSASPPGPDAADLVEIRTTALPSAATGRPYTAMIEAAGPHAPLRWHVTGGQVPRGLLLDGATGIVEGWPRSPGRHAFEVEVRDGEDRDLARDRTFAAARRTFALVVERGPLTLLPDPAPRAQFRAPYAHRVEAVGGTPPCTFRVGSGRLPAGLRLQEDGTIAGAPEDRPGTYAVVIQAADAQAATAEGTVEVAVVVPPLGVTRGDLADAALGVAYDRAPGLSPRGGGSPYVWRVLPSEAALPPGLALDPSTGRLLGVATRSGVYAFRLEVRDAAAQAAGLDLTLNVRPGPVLESLTPKARPRDGRPVLLTGQAFQPGMTIAFQGTDPLPTRWESATRATVVVPATLALVGPVDVRVTNPDGGWHERTRGFRFPFSTIAFRDDGVHGTSLSSSRGIAAGDTDGDGLDDVVHVGSAGIEVLRPLGPPYAGAWRTDRVRASGSYNDVRLADVDRDGDLDLVTLRSATTETIETYRNDGAGGFPATASWSGTYRKPATHFPYALATGDVDGDGVPDLAFTSGSGNQAVVWVYRGLGDGSFALVHEAAGSVFDDHAGCFAPNAVALADLDGDGRDDVVLTDAFPTACAPGDACPATDGASNLRPGRGDVVAWVARSGVGGVPGPWRSVRLRSPAGRLDGDNTGLAVLDAEGDGDLDVAVVGGLRDTRGTGIALLRNEGGVLGEAFVLPTSVNRRFAVGLDADGDAADDLWVVGGDGRRGSQGAQGWSVAELLLGGTDPPLLAWTTGPETSEGIPGSNPGRVARGDFDGDGRPDVAVSQSFHAKERFANDQGDGLVEGVRIYVNRSR